MKALKMKALKISILAVVFCTLSMGAAAQENLPEAIAIPTGFEAEGIELGKGDEFFVGANSLSSLFGEAFFGVPHEKSAFAGAIYKGNLRTGEGAILVPPTGKPVSGLTYDRRTDYLYAATGFTNLVSGSFTGHGVIVYDASSGDLVTEITFGDGIVINDCLVTRRAVYCTDSINPNLYKVVLERGGRLPSTPVVEVIPMPGFEMVDGFNANGLVGKFHGRQLVVVNTTSGVLYRVDTATGVASPLRIEGAEQLFVDGDGLYLEGRTLYIMQNFSNKIAVVQLSGDLSGGEFIRNIGEGPDTPLDIATSIIGFGNSLYAINTHFFDLIFGDPAIVQSEVVRLRKAPRPVDDFDGDGKTDLAVFRPENGFWYILNSQDNSFRAVQFGTNGDIPIAEDYDGDNRADIAVYRPSDGNWYRINSTDGAFSAVQFGASEDKPVPADYDGDGKTDIAVFRPSSGEWHRLNSSDGSYTGVQWGISTDIPVPADFDKDGKADITVFRDGFWYRLRSSDGGFEAVHFGQAEDKPISADFDGDGSADTAVYRPSNGVWYWLESSDGDFQAIQFGISTDIPTPADYNGDGRYEQSVFRNGTWYVLRNDNSFYGAQFGQTGDVPIPGK